MVKKMAGGMNTHQKSLCIQAFSKKTKEMDME